MQRSISLSLASPNKPNQEVIRISEQTTREPDLLFDAAITYLSEVIENISEIYDRSPEMILDYVKEKLNVG